MEIVNWSQGAEWDEFVLATPGAGPYCLAGWREVFQATYGYAAHYLLAREGGTVTGVLPLLEIKAWPGRRHFTTLPGGLCATSTQAAGALLAAALALARRRGAAYLIVRDRAGCPQPAPGTETPMPDETIARHVGFRRSLAGGSQTVWRGFQRDVRNLVRRGQRAGFDLAWGAQQLPAWYPAFAENLQAKGTPALSLRFLQAAQARFPDRFTLLVLRRDGQLAGGGCHFVMPDTVWCTWGAIRSRYLPDHATYLMYWEIMRYFADAGVPAIDFGRSAAGSGHAAFKRQWGEAYSLDQQVYAIDGQRLPRLVTGDRPGRPVRLLQKAWQHLPAGVAVRLGNVLRRRIPFG